VFVRPLFRYGDGSKFNPTVPEEHVDDLPGHVERGEKCAGNSEIEWNGRSGPVVRRVKNFVFAPKAGEENRHAAKCHHADRVGREGDGHEFSQAAHSANVLFIVAAVNNGTRAEEEQRFEERVREQMKHADRDAADTKAHHHVTELRHGGVGKDAFDVGLRDCDERGEHGGDGADPGDNAQGWGSTGDSTRVRVHERIHTRDEEDAGGYHCRGVDECADGRGPFHGVRQPNVQRHLAGFSHGTTEDEQCDGSRKPPFHPW